jgi:hypothetical protein
MSHFGNVENKHPSKGRLVFLLQALNCLSFVFFSLSSTIALAGVTSSLNVSVSGFTGILHSVPVTGLQEVN